MSKRTLLRLLAVFFAFAIVAAACGDDDTSSENTNTDEETPTAGDGGTGEETPTTADGESMGAAGQEIGGMVVPENTLATEGPADDSLEPLVLGWINQDSGVPDASAQTGAIETLKGYLNTELGGIGGHPVDFRECDAGGTQEQTLACAQEMANSDDVSAIVLGLALFNGPIHDTAAAQNQIVFGGGPGTPNENVAPNSYFLAGGIIDLSAVNVAFVTDDLPEILGKEVTSVSLIGSDNPFGIAAADVAELMLAGRGITVERATIADTAPDAIAPMTAAKVGETDAFIVQVSQQQCIQIANAIEQQQIETPVVTSGLCVDEQTLEGLGGDYGLVEGWYVAGGQQGVGINDTPEIDELVYAVATYSSEAATTDDLKTLANNQAGVWNQVMTLKSILEEAGDVSQFVGRDSGEAIRAAILGYTGGVKLGGPDWECPGKTFPTVCGFSGQILQIDGEGVLAPVGAEGGFVDLRPLYAEFAALAGG